MCRWVQAPCGDSYFHTISGTLFGSRDFALPHCVPYQGIDFYCINNRFVLVDLPGYPDPEEMAHQGVLKKWEARWEDALAYFHFVANLIWDVSCCAHRGTRFKQSTCSSTAMFVQDLVFTYLQMCADGQYDL